MTDRRRPGMVARRHFEAMVFCYLAEELRTGDVAVLGSNESADWSAHLLPWEECQPKLAAFCEKVGLPDTPAAFVAHLKADAEAERLAAEIERRMPERSLLSIVATLPSQDPIAVEPSCGGFR
ncbi:hypothetical protein [Nonomuraea sp. NPDC048916]|uniref:hypothetical protein n=1 Tax=Nonomuraea sp. NPDC048916 TaxID=3154232 RepID=UPI0033FF9211